jgi:elongation factor P--beta-lysine ligase
MGTMKLPKIRSNVAVLGKMFRNEEISVWGLIPYSLVDHYRCFFQYL